MALHHRCGTFQAHQAHPTTAAPSPTPLSEPPPRRLVCPDCGSPLLLKASRYGQFYGCTQYGLTGCKGVVKADEEGNPVGALMPKAVREARRACHEMVTQIWRAGRMTKRQAYDWLAELLEVPQHEALIGVMSESDCLKLQQLLQQHMTDDELLAYTEVQMTGGPVLLTYTPEEAERIAALPRDRDALLRKLRSGFLKAGPLCHLLKIARPGEEGILVTNLLEAIRQFDRARALAPSTWIKRYTVEPGLDIEDPGLRW